MKNTLVLISNPAQALLDDKIVQRAAELLWSNGGSVGTPDWLAPGIACDLPFDGKAAALSFPGIDAVVVATANRRKRLLVADMESTMIENEMLDELADFLGLREKIAGITARAMNGELDFAAALNERVGLLAGLPVARLDEAARRIRYMPGGATLVATMKQHGAACALVSGGFTYFTAMVKTALGFDFDAANVLKHDGKALAGAVELPILGKEAKLATLDRLCQERGLHIGETITVGDGANDLPMLKAAGMGVAFHAKPVVAAEVAARIDHGDLTALLYLQGYRQSDFIERPDPLMTDAVQIVLAKRPMGDVTADCFREEKVTLPALADGQILVAQRFLSLDPYMRPRMTELRSYVPPFNLDQPLTGGSIGEVVESRNPKFAKGDLVMGLLNWATHTVHDGKGLRPISAGGVPLSAYLGVLGMPSFTAWYGIKHICKPKAGETVFVSAATGAVGQVAGQLAKLAGARVVGCAGDEDKCVWAVREAGYDACFNHRTERDYGAVLDKLCPKGIDADFENVGGKLFHAVFERLNNFGRVAFCGAISEYQDTDPMAGPPKMFSIVQKRLTVQGFIVSDHAALMNDFIGDVAPLLPSGQLKSRETVIDGLSKAPQAFMGLLKGQNFGKLVVKVG